MAQSRSVFLYCMAAALHNPALSSLVPRCRLALCRSLLRAENPNLPSVSPFRRMMDDAERPAEGSTPAAPFLGGRRVPVGTTGESRGDLFTTMRRNGCSLIRTQDNSQFKQLMLEFIERYTNLIYKLANSIKMCWILDGKKYIRIFYERRNRYK